MVGRRQGGLGIVAAAALLVCAAASCAPGQIAGAMSFGGPTFVDGVTVRDVAVAANGDVIVTGWFTGSVRIGSTSITSAGGNDGFVARVSPVNHTAAWVQTLGSVQNDLAAGVTVDGNRVYVVGTFAQTITIGSTTLTSAGDGDVVVAALDATTGAPQWATRAGSAYQDVPSDVAVRNGAIAVSASQGTTNSAYAWLLVLATDGHITHQVTLTGATRSDAFGVAIDTTDHMLVTGSFKGTLNVGGTRLTSAGDEDVFLAQFTIAGDPLWARRYGGSGLDRPAGIAAAPNGDVVIAGGFTSTATFGTTTLAAQGASDVFLVRVSSTGAIRNLRSFGTKPYALVSAALAVDGNDNVALTGTAIGTVDFGPGLRRCLRSVVKIRSSSSSRLVSRPRGSPSGSPTRAGSTTTQAALPRRRRHRRSLQPGRSATR